MEIRQKFWGAFKKNRSILVINQYQGLPVTCQATICMVGQDILAISTHPRQLERIKRERHTYLRCNTNDELIKAVPIAFDKQDKMVFLSNFSPVEQSAIQHMRELNVRPKDLVAVDMRLNELSLAAILLNLIKDEDGLLQLRILIKGQPEVHQKDTVSLSFNLSRPIGQVQARGEVTRVNRSNRNRQTYLRIQPLKENPAARQLKDYISYRKTEIEEELSK